MDGDGGDTPGPTDTTGVGVEESYAYPHRLNPRTHVRQRPTVSKAPHCPATLRSLTGPIPSLLRVSKPRHGPPSPVPGRVLHAALDPRSRPSGARFRATKPHQRTSQSVVQTPHFVTTSILAANLQSLTIQKSPVHCTQVPNHLKRCASGPSRASDAAADGKPKGDE